MSNLLMRRRMMTLKSRPYQQVSRVRIKNSAYSWPEGSMDVNLFYASSSDVKIYLKTYVSDISSCQLGTRLINRDGGSDLYVASWKRTNDGMLTSQARNADDSIIFQYVRYPYIYTSQKATFDWSSSTPGITTNVSFKSGGGFVNGNSSTYSTWKNSYNNVPIQKLVIQGGPNNQASGRTAYIDEIKVLISDSPVVDLIPVLFTDTNEYGLIDTVSGNYMDKSCFADNTVVFEA